METKYRPIVPIARTASKYFERQSDNYVETRFKSDPNTDAIL